MRAVILAAGQGTRMKSGLPKVLHPVAGRPMVSWVVEAVAAAGCDEVLVVVGHGAEEVQAILPDGVRTAIQEQQHGTGHAAMVALEALGETTGDTVVIIPGDTPLLSAATVAGLIEQQHSSGPTVTMLTSQIPDPTGYGRVIRSESGAITGIVEERDADERQRSIKEIGWSMYAFNGGELPDALRQVGTDNDQGEVYLTDVIGILARQGKTVEARDADPEEVQGVNSHDQLAEVARILRRQINAGWMQAGVAMFDPDRVYLDADVHLEPGVMLMPDVYLQGASSVAAGARVGPSVFVEDSTIGPGARVWFAVLRGAQVGENAEVGPYASLRPGSVLGPETKAGTFVETKNTTVGPRSKVPHLSYMGDATIGQDSNIGAGTITCNYDGFEKHATVIGDRVRIGSDTMLVAPIEIADDAWTGAGSVITNDVPEKALGVERTVQKEIPDYAARRKSKRRSDT